ncbi:hypothetical protein SDRG_16544 [Saprolegnia diclina VS20]|uniref:Elicitin n=1 Tax=Saprolegnia diclina (strain VS20) TaxID=1156394 RepID=T0PJM0_SAPDV|nr:hypothetical protein SDRG_16544 [Saprolegnia diclina VS20]EQC25574.1 hypothetical protein SDRG_16544 [Saprolegnia diclina VS20]|eukprot:XP_008620981.1 hypothetical protein SDRG_16544 [Saprolegnia diclina VS20]
MVSRSLRLAAAGASVALAQDNAAYCTDATLLQVHLPLCRSVNLPACSLASGYAFGANSEFPSQHQWSVLCQHESCQTLFLELRQIQFPVACRYFGVDNPKVDFVGNYFGSLCAPFHYN